MPGIGSVDTTSRSRTTVPGVRRTLPTAARRRLALVLIPLALVYTLIAIGEGLWLLAVPGVIFLIAQIVVLVKSGRRRGAPPRPPIVTSSPTAQPTRRPPSRRPGRRRPGR
jgi:hypothetical protein